MAQQVPSIGRVVHYVAYGTPNGEYQAGAHRAAIITQTHVDDTQADSPLDPTRVSLCVLNPTGMFFNQYVLHSEEHEPGTWHWPEYVPAKA